MHPESTLIHVSTWAGPWARRSGPKPGLFFRVKPLGVPQAGADGRTLCTNYNSGQIQTASRGASKQPHEGTANLLVLCGNGTGDPSNAFVFLADVPTSPQTRTLCCTL